MIRYALSGKFGNGRPSKVNNNNKLVFPCHPTNQGVGYSNASRRVTILKRGLLSLVAYQVSNAVKKVNKRISVAIT